MDGVDVIGRTQAVPRPEADMGDLRTSGTAESAPSPESYTWPLILLALVILAQVFIPSRDRIGPDLVVPLTETFVWVLMAAVAAIPGPVPQRARPLMLTLFALLVAANAFAAGRLVNLVLSSGKIDGVTPPATRLLTAGALVIVTNMITFGLLYWQLDSGGPVARVAHRVPWPDFQFPQTSAPDLSSPDWRPRYADYLFVAYTNVFAFSPTDTMPLTRRAKGLMTLQSMISVAVGVVVIARVINVLPS
jgi:hypothetical protein